MGAYRQGHPVLVGDTTILPDIQREISDATLLVGFNFKFDLHWLRRAGLSFEGKRIWDCQVARFLLEAQRTPPRENSLSEACRVYGASPKSTSIEDNYWSKGIDTPDIPREEMLAYLKQDLKSTWEVYHAQRTLLETMPQAFQNLFWLHMDDLLVLEEMEWNGLKFNVDKALEEEKKASKRVNEIEEVLRKRCPNTPINWDSGDHLSAYLYGGTIEVRNKVPHGTFKTGAKAGQVRFKWETLTYRLARLVDPLKNSELKKADKEKDTGPWSTSEDVLKQIKQITEVKLLLERAKLTKLLDYLTGFPSLMVEKQWNMLHGNFNQSIARTGRLSSSEPNLQNLPDPVLALVESRYDLS